MVTVTKPMPLSTRVQEACDEFDIDEDCDELADDSDNNGTVSGALTFFVDNDGDGSPNEYARYLVVMGTRRRVHRLWCITTPPT